MLVVVKIKGLVKISVLDGTSSYTVSKSQTKYNVKYMKLT